MRAANLLLPALVSLATVALPAFAQSPGFQQQMDLQIRADELRAQQDLANRQAVIQQNELSRLETQMSGQQALADVRDQSYTPRLPPAPSGLTPNIDTSRLASIPDAALAASNARVKAAAENRR